MNIYFSSRDIPSISHLPLTERLARIQQAQNSLTGPEKLLLNVLKLSVLLPIFILIFRSTENWYSLLWAALVAALYPVVLRPIQYSLCAKYLPKIDHQGE
ncbi:DUF6170 family protein [Paraglaciecola polaris]|uniref:Uncharacterized protein n=1 Tax=Paraglaciecola polaris LMG 21857 TaxID=1129793 RepID=K6ZXH4_9ALTE|nr:DUF6170 family protein [Paraglaciecola polaris]GAC33448.1 hypothetical protein GPLA_2550 [Paraglaciecola polaris LMG 21857]